MGPVTTTPITNLRRRFSCWQCVWWGWVQPSYIAQRGTYYGQCPVIQLVISFYSHQWFKYLFYKYWLCSHQLKKTYKDNYNELKATESDMSYCQKLVEQARLRLVSEFDMWFTESFIQMGDQTRPSTTTAPLTAMAPSPSPQMVGIFSFSV